MTDLLAKLAGLSEVAPWAKLDSYEPNPGATLFGGVSVTPNDLEALILLEDQLKGLSHFMSRVMKTPACPIIDGGEDDFI